MPPRYPSAKKNLNKVKIYNSQKSKSMKTKIQNITHDLSALMFFFGSTMIIGFAAAQTTKFMSSWLELSSGWTLCLSTATPLLFMFCAIFPIARITYKFYGAPQTKFVQDIVKES